MNNIYWVHKAKEPKYILALKDIILSSVAESIKLDKNKISLENIHNQIKISEVNEIRLKAFRDINSIDWKSIAKKIAYEELANILGPDLCIQRKINLSIQMPNDNTSILGPHTDCNSGDSPFQYNLWIPLTDAFSTNSMFILNEEESIEYYENINKTDSELPKAKEENFVKVVYGEYLLFPPSLIHGNVLNKTSTTRVSLNVRIKSLFAPDLEVSPPDRKFGTYYESWHQSIPFKWNKRVYQYLSK